jgi:hypothetical protein
MLAAIEDEHAIALIDRDAGDFRPSHARRQLVPVRIGS